MRKLFFIMLAVVIETSAYAGKNMYENNRYADISIKEIKVFPVKCFGQASGGIEVRANGGKLPHLYSIDGINFQTEPVFKGLKSGHYKLYVKDAEGKVKHASCHIPQPDKIKFLPPKITSSSCCNPDGAVLVSATGGKGSISYQINDGEFQSSGYFKGLSGGYTITAKDSAGCKSNLVVTIRDFNGPLIDFINITDASCAGGNNGSIQLFAVGGTGNIKYSIDGGNTYSDNPVFKNLKAGTYTAKIKDETGCTDAQVIIIEEPAPIEIFTDAIISKNKKEVSVQVKYSIGGTGNHYYSLNGTDFQVSGNFKIALSDEQVIYVKDVAGCVFSEKIIREGEYIHNTMK